MLSKLALYLILFYSVVLNSLNGQVSIGVNLTVSAPISKHFGTISYGFGTDVNVYYFLKNFTIGAEYGLKNLSGSASSDKHTLQNAFINIESKRLWNFGLFFGLGGGMVHDNYKIYIKGVEYTKSESTTGYKLYCGFEKSITKSNKWFINGNAQYNSYQLKSKIDLISLSLGVKYFLNKPSR